jgi:spore coat protein A
MQLISRQKFNAKIDEETGKPTNIRLVGQPQYPGTDEAGWKDTWVMNPGEVTRVIAKFDREGLYVWHCHILSHEEHDMMRPFYVGQLPDQLTKKIETRASSELDNLVQLKIMPNPFNNYASIQFNLNEAKTITINLYDNKASLVRQIYTGKQPAGLQRFTIDGSSLSNGVYFCEIILNRQRILRKLVLNK